jgi:septum site-determining protein MinC
MEAPACFQFKASFSPCTILQLTRYDLTQLELQLAATVARAPNFFLGTPVIIDLEKISHINDIDFITIKQMLTRIGLVPMGVRGGAKEQVILAATAGLPLVTVGKTATALAQTMPQTSPDSTTDNALLNPDGDAPSHSNQEESTTDKAGYELTPSKTLPRVHNTKLVTQPIRSGVQVYAKDGDLIIVGQVSAGAELLSDGHIHVYGPLRGRALAGLTGNTQARIFCRTLEAELVSIAGFYLTKEDMQVLPAHDGMIQIYLENDQVKIEAI